ncbi:hypothetical protein WR25_00101 isoform A [Diploscapter pachys]|uniref:Homeobox domain-containing protein n=1 Tax=Diploscapter pachys TaxID=2018661 RepID=A0A2A2J961_9BILA|nr:hypothetical protein WR25_00101 isoform A [Diploscapter pachys]
MQELQCPVCRCKPKVEPDLEIHISLDHLDYQPWHCVRCLEQRATEHAMREHWTVSHQGEQPQMMFQEVSENTRILMKMMNLAKRGEKGEVSVIKRIIKEEMKKENTATSSMSEFRIETPLARIRSPIGSYECRICKGKRDAKKTKFRNDKVINHFFVHLSELYNLDRYSCMNCDFKVADCRSAKNHSWEVHCQTMCCTDESSTFDTKVIKEASKRIFGKKYLIREKSLHPLNPDDENKEKRQKIRDCFDLKQFLGWCQLNTNKIVVKEQRDTFVIGNAANDKEEKMETAPKHRKRKAGEESITGEKFPSARTMKVRPGKPRQNAVASNLLEESKSKLDADADKAGQKQSKEANLQPMISDASAADTSQMTEPGGNAQMKSIDTSSLKENLAASSSQNKRMKKAKSAENRLEGIPLPIVVSELPLPTNSGAEKSFLFDNPPNSTSKSSKNETRNEQSTSSSETSKSGSSNSVPIKKALEKQLSTASSSSVSTSIVESITSVEVPSSAEDDDAISSLKAKIKDVKNQIVQLQQNKKLVEEKQNQDEEEYQKLKKAAEEEVNNKLITVVEKRKAPETGEVVWLEQKKDNRRKRTETERQTVSRLTHEEELLKEKEESQDVREALSVMRNRRGEVRKQAYEQLWQLQANKVAFEKELFLMSLEENVENDDLYQETSTSLQNENVASIETIAPFKVSNEESQNITQSEDLPEETIRLLVEVSADEQRASVVGVFPTNDSNDESNNDQDEPLLHLPIKAEALDYCQEETKLISSLVRASSLSTLELISTLAQHDNPSCNEGEIEKKIQSIKKEVDPENEQEQIQTTFTPTTLIDSNSRSASQLPVAVPRDNLSAMANIVEAIRVNSMQSVEIGRPLNTRLCLPIAQQVNQPSRPVNLAMVPDQLMNVVPQHLHIQQMMPSPSSQPMPMRIQQVPMQTPVMASNPTSDWVIDIEQIRQQRNFVQPSPMPPQAVDTLAPIPLIVNIQPQMQQGSFLVASPDQGANFMGYFPFPANGMVPLFAPQLNIPNQVPMNQGRPQGIITPHTHATGPSNSMPTSPILPSLTGESTNKQSSCLKKRLEKKDRGILLKYFERNSKPTFEERSRMAAELGTERRCIDLWFAKRRTQMKKLQAKMENEKRAIPSQDPFHSLSQPASQVSATAYMVSPSYSTSFQLPQNTFGGQLPTFPSQMPLDYVEQMQRMQMATAPAMSQQQQNHVMNTVVAQLMAENQEGRSSSMMLSNQPLNINTQFLRQATVSNAGFEIVPQAEQFSPIINMSPIQMINNPHFIPQQPSSSRIQQPAMPSFQSNNVCIDKGFAWNNGQFQG